MDFTHRSSTRRRKALIIGLGAIGEALCRSLKASDVEVVAVDSSAERIQSITEVVPNARYADLSDERVIEQLPFGEVDHVVIAVEDDFLVSVLAALQAKDAGAADVWATALDPRHARVLELVGVDHVIDPGVMASQQVAAELSARVANL